MSAEDRHRRNTRIMALFVAGNTESEIGRVVNLTGARVHQILKAELKNAARHRQLLTDQALAIYVTRLETLIRAAWPGVVQQDPKFIEIARRLLEQQARLYDLEEDRMPGLPPMAENELSDDDGLDPRDELAQYRRRHRTRPGEATGTE